MNLLGLTAIRHFASAAASLTRHLAVKSLGDFALVSAGMAMATGSVVFAGYSLMGADHGPQINGLQYLAIFAQPRGQHAPAAESAPTPNVAGDALDMAPTGSIHGAAASPAAPAYRIFAVERDMVWLSNGTELRVVRPGDVAPGIGRVASIAKREGHWALLDESGATLLVADSNPVAPTAGDGPFARRMIFGSGE
jgi:hypothetical protein